MGDITTRQPSENLQKQFGQFYNFSHKHDVLVSELPPSRGYWLCHKSYLVWICQEGHFGPDYRVLRMSWVHNQESLRKAIMSLLAGSYFIHPLDSASTLPLSKDYWLCSLLHSPTSLLMFPIIRILGPTFPPNFEKIGLTVNKLWCIYILVLLFGA